MGGATPILLNPCAAFRVGRAPLGERGHENVCTCGCRSAEVYLPLHPALMWHLRCLSTLLLCVFIPSSVFYFCFLIYPSSVYRYGKQLGEKRSLLPNCLHDFYDFVLYPGRLSLIDSSYKWIQNHDVNVSEFACLAPFACFIILFHA